jgi:hypothetical protein
MAEFFDDNIGLGGDRDDFQMQNGAAGGAASNGAVGRYLWIAA